MDTEGTAKWIHSVVLGCGDTLGSSPVRFGCLSGVSVQNLERESNHLGSGMYVESWHGTTGCNVDGNLIPLRAPLYVTKTPIKWLRETHLTNQGPIQEGQNTKLQQF